MEKITLKQNQTIEINGAIINSRIVDLLNFLQSSNASGAYYTNGSGKSGIEDIQKDYNGLIVFLASEAGNIEDKNELAAYLCSISYMRERWSEFYFSNLQE